MKCGADINGPQRKKCNDFGDKLTKYSSVQHLSYIY